MLAAVAVIELNWSSVSNPRLPYKFGALTAFSRGGRPPGPVLGGAADGRDDTDEREIASSKPTSSGSWLEGNRIGLNRYKRMH